MAELTARQKRDREYNQKRYKENREVYYRRNKEKIARMAAHLRETKNRPCMDCDGRFPSYVMTFDHRPGEVKLYKPTQLPRIGSWRILKEELAKCDVVCANCHQIRTHERAVADGERLDWAEEALEAL